MGCASSKQTRRCSHCRSPYSTLHRSYTVHHPAQREGDSYHVVALTSSTLDSLNHPHDSSSIQNPHHHHDYPFFTINSNDHKKNDDQFNDYNNDSNNDMMKSSNKEELSLEDEVIQAKSWSKMISEKIPKVIPRTPTRTPPGEPETINTWELMEGLEDYSPLRLPNYQPVGRSFSFHAIPFSSSISINSPPKPKLQEIDTASPPAKPLWLQMNDIDSDSNPIISDFDPDIISSFRKALEELSPTNPFHLRPPENEKLASPANQLLFSMDVKTEKVNSLITEASKCPPNGEDKVVLYFTSLRGVRKTYEDCCHVKVILKGFGIRIDERDVSMHSGFREELKELLGGEFRGVLPRVFVKGRYIGGAEEVKQMHEDGELEKVLEECELEEEGGGKMCEACGDLRFLPCERCSGSCKIYYEVDDDEEEEEEEGEYGFQRCPDCNENGIVRCHVCCCS